ncbi:N-acetyltransferase DgcN [Vibrio caribbeanicus]|uniref:N-acetyltransferase DgcN n=1 Tax=Vibrio caribbeanicus TaxID=701175 RepID=UPI0030DD9505
MSIPQPYLLFLGDVTDAIAAKTARGIAFWRPESCIGQLRLNKETISLGLPDLSLQAAKEKGAKTLVLGTANAGGVIPNHWHHVLIAAADMGYEIASGMHSRLSEITPLRTLIENQKLKVHDVRHFDQTIAVGTGRKRTGKRILTVGTDCSVGKMYTALALHNSLSKLNIRSQFRATGQTGIFIEGEGVPVDAIVADFISGAVETLSPDFDEHDWDIIEGQGSLFHPSFAGVSLGLLHGAQADALIVCHELYRPHMRHLPHLTVPSLQETIRANLEFGQLTNKDVRIAGISLNTSRVDETEAKKICKELQLEFDVPVTDPVRFGIENMAKYILGFWGD